MLCKSGNIWLLAAFLSFSAAAEQSTQATPAPDSAADGADTQRKLFEAQLRLEEKVIAAIENSSDAARAFGQLLTAGDRRRLQSGCSSLARNPDNTRARHLLQDYIERHRDQRPQVITRYCFGPSLRQLQQEVRATRRALQQRPATAANDNGFDFRLQRLQQAAGDEQRRYAAIRKLMLAGN